MHIVASGSEVIPVVSFAFEGGLCSLLWFWGVMCPVPFSSPGIVVCGVWCVLSATPGLGYSGDLGRREERRGKEGKTQKAG